jgi:D-glycero-beta-D-manno-heptose-7-phosphate kinase
MRIKDLAEIFHGFNSLKVLIVGDVMIDSYIWGNVERISPEAPIPVLRARKKEIRLGGAANVALNVQSLGALPIICSVIGDDPDSSSFIGLLNSRGISDKGIIKSPNRITTIKERYMAGSQHLLRVDTEEDNEIHEIEQAALIGRIHELLPKCHVVIFQDYDKGTLTEKVISDTIRMALELGIPTVVDPKKRNFLSYRNVTLFKPNLKEVKEGLKIDFDANDPKQLAHAMNMLMEILGASCSLLTLSDKGVYVDDGNEQHHLPAHLRTISDVSGAGDTVISIAGVCMAKKLPIKLMAELSNLGGGLVCEYAGVVPVDKSRLYEEAVRFLGDDDKRTMGHK